MLWLRFSLTGREPFCGNTTFTDTLTSILHVLVSLKSRFSVDGENHKVIHIREDGAAENVNAVAQVSDTSADFAADSFSVYAIVRTGDASHLPLDLAGMAGCLLLLVADFLFWKKRGRKDR